ncbi:hypothetical protein QUF54_01350 [Candidatus Marithioploca araucensis]|uniref:MFS transporter n=1 Tax=Candidatus Marithioploca araucensis TaxID=70273 RepID=A0ABT7VQN8_9GAMM|nr:hypothetical protein [Candidatus Marithioploca araucensis]
MIARLLGLLSIKSNEWEGVLYFFLVLLVFSFGASFARSIAMTLLIGEWGGDKLPIMYILIDLAAIMGFIRYAHYTNKFNGLSILKFLLLSTALFSIIAQILFLLTTYWWTQQKWVYGFFFVGFSFFFILISIHAGSVVASYFTAVQVKRVTSIVNAGIPIGGVLGGSSLLFLLRFFHIPPQYLVGVFSGACFGAFLLLRMVKTHLSPVREMQREGTYLNPLKELINAFKYTLSSRLMIFMSLGLILFVITQKLLEYQYQTVIYFNIYENDKERIAFFATYEIFANLILLFFQLFLTSRIVMKMGVGASNMVYPILTTIMALTLFLYFYSKMQGLISDCSMIMMLSLGIITQFVNQEMRWALRTPTNNLLFNAIQPSLWGSNKAFLNGIVFPLSTFLAGGLIIMITGTNSSMMGLTLNFTEEQVYYLLPLIAVIVSFFGIIVALPQWAAYNKEILELLNIKVVEQGLDKISGKPSNNLKQMIQQKLNSADPEHMTVVLEVIRVLRLNDFVNQVGNLLLNTQDFQIKKHCINTLAALPQSQSNLTYLVEALHTEKEATVLPLILKELAQFKSVNFNEYIEKLLTHPSPSVFVEASLCLHGHPRYKSKSLIEKNILERLQKLPDKALYLYALGELRQPHYSNIVLPFFQDKKSEIRVAAFTAFIRLLDNQLEPHKPRLIDALNSQDKEIKVESLKALKRCKSLDDWTPIIRLLKERDRSIVTESKELLRLSLNLCGLTLIEHLFSHKISVQQRFEILSLIYPKLNEKQRQRLRENGNNALKQFVQVNGLLKLHESLENTNKVNDLITKILQEITEDHLLHVLTIITFASEQNMEFFQRVSGGLLSSNCANQGNALEVLSNAREKYLTDRVIKYFEERVNNLKAIRHIHIALFKEILKIDKKRYYSLLLALDHDMLKACLLYLEREKMGCLKLNNANENVRKLLL